MTLPWLSHPATANSPVGRKKERKEYKASETARSYEPVRASVERATPTAWPLPQRGDGELSWEEASGGLAVPPGRVGQRRRRPTRRLAAAGASDRTPCPPRRAGRVGRRRGRGVPARAHRRLRPFHSGAVRPQVARGEGGDRIPGARRLSGEPRRRPRNDRGGRYSEIPIGGGRYFKYRPAPVLF